MYNSEQKGNFIKDYTSNISTRNLCLKFFSIAEKYEEVWGADICTRQESDVKCCVEEFVTNRAATIARRSIIVRSYGRWCLDNGIPGACEGLLRVKINGFEKIRTRLVMGPEHLQKCLNEICRPDTFDATDNVFRTTCWLIYNGVDLEKLQSISVTDINLYTASYRYGAARHVIYPEAMAAFRSCVMADGFYVSGNSPETASVFTKRVDGDMLLRGIKGYYNVNSLRVEFSRRRKKAENDVAMNLTIDRLYIAGRYYRWRQEERMGIQPDIVGYVVDEFNKVEHNCSDVTRKEMLRLRIKEAEDEYNNWKFAYM